MADDRNCSQFAIDPDTGMVSVVVGAVSTSRATSSYQLSVSVWDGYARSAPETVTININNLNDNEPSVTRGSDASTSTAGRTTSIDALEVSDPDDVNQLGFTTFSGFAIVSGNTNSVFRLRATG